MSEIITPEIVAAASQKTPPWGFNGMGQIVYTRTYARRKPDGTRETWPETIARCINGAQDIGAGYSKAEALRLFDHMFNLRCSFAGRALWQLGTPVIERIGGASLLNCWFVPLRDPEAFPFIFEHLMLGGGVGFSVRREDVHQLPRVLPVSEITADQTRDADFIVPDSREGWVELLRRTVNAWFITGKGFRYSTCLIRSAGEPIATFGGLASGPGALVEGISDICSIFRSRVGKRLRSVDALDIANIIGKVVVSGNVRRSAQLAGGDPDDFLFIRAKRWDLGQIPPWRDKSNNSIYADDFSHIASDIWKGYTGNGEPYGFLNIPLAKKFGRLGEKKIRPDHCEGFNPCAEIALEPYECCNLAEVFLNNIRTSKELIDCACLLYKAQKATATLPFGYEETNEVVQRNMRLGLGVTGLQQVGVDKAAPMLSETYKYLREFDRVTSKDRGLHESIGLTTVKPSGTLSILAGSTPGVHPAYAPFYRRRVRMAWDDDLVKACSDAGYHVEDARHIDGSPDHTTKVVSFPCAAGAGARVAADAPAVSQLEDVKTLQTVWSDNAVSCTVYYHESELPEIQAWLKDNYKDGIKSVSFLKHAEHGFQQAPYEEITEKEYLHLKSKTKPVDTSAEGQLEESFECAGGQCPVK